MTAGKVERLVGVEEQNRLLGQGLKRGVAVASLGEAALMERQRPCVQGQQLNLHVEGEGSGQTMAARSARCATVVHHACLLRGFRGGVMTEATIAAQVMGSPETVPHHVIGQHGLAQPSAASLGPCAFCQTSFSFVVFQAGMVGVALC